MRVWRIEFTEDEKYHNLMTWLIYTVGVMEFEGQEHICIMFLA